jgi:hypothetical protein
VLEAPVFMPPFGSLQGLTEGQVEVEFKCIRFGGSRNSSHLPSPDGCLPRLTRGRAQGRELARPWAFMSFAYSDLEEGFQRALIRSGVVRIAAGVPTSCGERREAAEIEVASFLVSSAMPLATVSFLYPVAARLPRPRDPICA